MKLIVATTTIRVNMVHVCIGVQVYTPVVVIRYTCTSYIVRIRRIFVNITRTCVLLQYTK